MKKEKLNAVLDLIRPKCKKNLYDSDILVHLDEIYELGREYGKEMALDSKEYYAKFNHHSQATVPASNEALAFIKDKFTKLHGRHSIKALLTGYKGPDIDTEKDCYHYEYYGTFKEQIEEKRLTFFKALYMLYFMGWCDSHIEFHVPVKEPEPLDFKTLNPETIDTVKRIWESLK